MKPSHTRAISIIAFASVCLGSCSARAEDLADVYDRVKGSVVVIATAQKELDPLVQGRLVSVAGLGSGVLVSPDGKIVTAAHVVQTADRVQVLFLGGEVLEASVVASEPAVDLALLQLAGRPATVQPAKLGDSGGVRVGDSIFVVGAPLGMAHTVTVGHVSARREADSLFGEILPTEMFQTDAAVNQGNSGGPMFNMHGEVIGIVSNSVSRTGGFDGLGFAITSNMVRRVLLESRSLWSGFQGFMLAGEFAEIFNLPQSRGVLVERVAERSPAAQLGLRGGTIPAQVAGVELIVGGDIILEARGISLAEDDAYARMRASAATLEPGEEIVLQVLRGGTVVELRARFAPDRTLGERAYRWTTTEGG